MRLLECVVSKPAANVADVSQRSFVINPKRERTKILPLHFREAADNKILLRDYFDLQPRVAALGFVPARCALRHHAFQPLVSRCLEQVLAIWKMFGITKHASREESG